MTHKINDLFSCPVYRVEGDSNFELIEEKKEIENIINDKGMHKRGEACFFTYITNIFDTKLKKIKEFCEKHIKIYVEELLNPREEFDFYITQSWLHVIEPGGNINRHWHPNSIISGTFYVSTVENDNICFFDPNEKIKQLIKIEPKAFNPSNSDYTMFPYMAIVFPVNTHDLLLFPSWLEHSVEPNEKATINRISISFDVFAKGKFNDLQMQKIHL